MNKRAITGEEAVNLIRSNVSHDHLLCQLAEEAAELSKAALKLRRCIVPGNPARMTKEEAEAALLEETADTLLLCGILGMIDKVDELSAIQRDKLERWLGDVMK